MQHNSCIAFDFFFINNSLFSCDLKVLEADKVDRICIYRKGPIDYRVNMSVDSYRVPGWRLRRCLRSKFRQIGNLVLFISVANYHSYPKIRAMR